ncbi:helix-turn-helix domain-containing protein [Priestia megaterium]|uniref:helix-turn-helix domain-containing protein n=1 Tax=Priestia megaterium TaxID=1404 RepID=UPI0025A441F1|nr:helix-turn-helix transcriptional regulator [Priestia megaterium]MDM8149971.1 helix-turn-helix transcriptional regulator [Priestia megaterium]
MEEFKLSGRTVRIARLLKNVQIKEVAAMTGIAEDYLSKIERGVTGANVTYRNHFRLLRALRELGYTDAQIAVLTILVENIKEKEEQTV